MIDVKKIDFKKVGGLVPTIVQNVHTGQVLMLGYMNKQALKKTLESKRITFWSRCREELWVKGSTSSNYLNLVNIYLDCDNDSLLIEARPEGPTCHSGDVSCFGNAENEDAFKSLFSTILKRKRMLPKNSYTTFLFKKGIKKITEKVEEEAEEVCRASREENKTRVAEEAADLIYHLFVLMASRNVDLTQVKNTLKKRSKYANIVGDAGLEPATSSTSMTRSSQLS